MCAVIPLAKLMSEFDVAPVIDNAGMCELCDGNTYEQVFETMRDHVGAGKWALQGVEPGASSPGWVYTVGLIQNFDHPELVVVNGDLRSCGALLDEIGLRISRGLRVDAGATLDLGGYVVEFGSVHASYLTDDLCASWENYYGWIGARPGPLRALQVAPPLAEWCDHCYREGRCLSVPGARGFGSGLNRSARRAQARRHRRR